MEMINVSDAKKHFSDILGRVFYGKEEVIIIRRNKAMARLIPIEQKVRIHLADAKGWLDDNDEFFGDINRIVKTRGNHLPRIFHKHERKK